MSEIQIAEFWHSNEAPTQYVLLSDFVKLQNQLKEAHEVIGFSFGELLEGVSHDHFCAGYCVSHGNEICNCSQKPLLDLIKRAREYQEKWKVKNEN